MPAVAIALQKVPNASECPEVGLFSCPPNAIRRIARISSVSIFGGRHGDNTRLQGLLASVGVAALGSATLVTLLAGNTLILAGASETAADTSQPFLGPDFPICHTPVAKGPPMMLRLAQTEVPRAEMSAANAAPAFADTEPPLWTGLGSVTYKISTKNERAQTYFDQGLRLAYAFNHGEAQRAFRMAQKLDPDCAMCFWGEAFVLGPNINLPMQEDAVAPAFAAAQKAKALARQGEPPRAGADRRARSALRQRSEGRPRAV